MSGFFKQLNGMRSVLNVSVSKKGPNGLKFIPLTTLYKDVISQLLYMEYGIGTYPILWYVLQKKGKGNGQNKIRM